MRHLSESFLARRIQLYGYLIAGIYAASFFAAYLSGRWLLDCTGTPLLLDFTAFWIGGVQALHGTTGLLYDPAAFAKLQTAVVGPYSTNRLYPNWPYPPVFFLILPPFAALPYLPAFLAFQAATLSSFLAVIYRIVRRPEAIALALASPFFAFNLNQGQTGFLSASLVGATLLTLERLPVLAGFFLGCLTYKPQLGVLYPLALMAAGHWRALVSAAITSALLVGASMLAFGIQPWIAFPHELLAQTGDYLLHDDPLGARWAWINTVFGFVRALYNDAAFAWCVQGSATAGAAVIIWMVWRSSARFALKAALLSLSELIATPYAWNYDLTVVAISVAFLARDQIRFGPLRGEQAILIALFGLGIASLAIGLWGIPCGPVMVVILFGVVLRRICWYSGSLRRRDFPIIASKCLGRS